VKITEPHDFLKMDCPRCGLVEEIDVTEEAVAAVALPCPSRKPVETTGHLFRS